MKTIDENLVESAWHEVNSYKQEKSYEEMVALAEKQPNLVAFVYEFTQDLSIDAQELAMYILFVVYRMFEKSAAGEIKKIETKSIVSSYDNNEAFITSLENVPDQFLKKKLGPVVQKQPHVLQYVLESMLEKGPGDAINLTEEDIGMIFIIEKTMVDVLDAAID
jgi:hypothetical protein